MKDLEKSKRFKGNNKEGCLTGIALLLITLALQLLPLIIGIKVSQYLHINLYIGFFVSLLLLGAFLAVQVRNKFLPPTATHHKHRTPRDVAAIYFGITLFNIILFYPTLLENNPIWAYSISCVVALAVGLLIAYILGTNDLRKNIANLRNHKRSIKPKKVDPEKRKQAIRDLVMAISAFFFVIAPFIFSVLLAAKVSRWLGSTSPLGGFDASIFIALIIVFVLVGEILGATIWVFLMSFLLPLKQWEHLTKGMVPRTSFVKPAVVALLSLFLKWKLMRENTTTNI